LKRLALLREYAAKWTTLGLTAANLKSLGTYLDAKLNANPCDHSHRFTEAWLTEKGMKPEGDEGFETGGRPL
jgi:hypothetical protein